MGKNYWFRGKKAGFWQTSIAGYLWSPARNGGADGIKGRNVIIHNTDKKEKRN